MNIVGFGWAPASWRSRCEVEVPDPFEIPAPSAELVPRLGLKVQFPGIHLLEMKNRDTPSSPFGDQTTFHFPINRHGLDWYTAEIASADEHLPDKDALEGRELAIILPRFPLQMPREIALLVSIQDEPSLTKYVLIESRVWIARETSKVKTTELQDEFDSGVAKVSMCGFILPPEQSWCVDGREQLVAEEPLEQLESPPPALPHGSPWRAKTIRRLASRAATGMKRAVTSMSGHQGEPRGSAMSPVRPSQSRTD